ncbi:MAG: UvrD-helicase domain-containing protein [Succinivibrio sp.]|nr:UvrD-helicase domain-containing protein [Succinivibrio sp.]
MSTPNKLNIGTLDLNQSALIEASAGTGKTYTITFLVLRLLLGAGIGAGARALPLEIDSILVVTFTRAAAAELKARIRERVRDTRRALEALAKAPEQEHESIICAWPDQSLQDLVRSLKQEGKGLKLCARILLKAERNIDDAPISTIHSFCNRALNQIYSFEAGENFGVELSDDLSEQEHEALYNLWRELFYAQDEQRCTLLQALGAHTPDCLNSLLKALPKVQLSRSTEGFLGYSISGVQFKLGKEEDAPAKLKASLTSMCRSYEKCLGSCPQLLTKLKSDLQGLNCQSLDPDALLAGVFLKKDGKVGMMNKDGRATLEALNELLTGDDLGSAELFEALLELKPIPEQGVISRLKADDYPGKLADPQAALALLGSLREFFTKLGALSDQVRTIQEQLKLTLALLVTFKVQEYCRRDGLMSNDDVLARLSRALCEHDQEGHLASLLRQRYPVAMIDEFQDTDPLQFSIFEQIYLNDKARAEKACCLLIGDPKQSIYAFKGADIHSYLKAAGQVGERRFTLDTNYRSARSLVQSVNEIFGGKLNKTAGDPFRMGQANAQAGESGIGFTAVGAKQGKCTFRMPITGASSQAEGESACYVQDVGTHDNKEGLSTAQAQAAASTIAEILSQGELLFPGKEPRKVVASDIAVLVRSMAESERIRLALEKHGIGSVYYSDRSSVLDSPEARSLVYLMQAMLRPAERGTVKKLLCSYLCGFSAAEYREKSQDSEMESEVRLLSRCAQIWQHSGFLGAFSLWFKAEEHKGLHRFLALSGGERAVTNFFHAAEIIQHKHQQLHSLQAQLRWYEQELIAPSEDSELTKKRLESERSQVKIYTIHKSKGLEFPLVLLPFVWSGFKPRGEKDALIYYDEQLKYRSLDLLKTERHLLIKKAEDEQEDARLLYVALTRACAANFLFLGRVGSRSQLESYSLPVELGCPVKLGREEDPGLYQKLLGELGDSAGFALRAPFADDAKAQTATIADTQAAAASVPAQPAVLPEGSVDRRFVISSYTSMVAGSHARMSSSADEREGEAPDTESQSVDRFSFARGTVTGDFLHGLLEHTDFTQLGYEIESNRRYFSALLDTPLKVRLSQVLASWRHAPVISSEGELRSMLSLWLSEVVTTPLFGADSKLSSCYGRKSLCDLKAGDYIPEMRYLIPVEELHSERLNELCRESAAGLVDAKAAARLELTPSQIRGFMTGSLDLVFRMQGEDGVQRYFVADYKSSYLGGSLKDYRESGLKASVFDPGNRYDVQYLVYSLALHRFLKLRDPSYDYEQNFGGVLYLYLRGMAGPGEGAAPGVFYTKPKLEIIESLDRLFGKEI